MNLKIFFSILFFALLVFSCKFHPNQSYNKFHDRDAAQLFSPGSITTPMSERDAAFSADGNTFYFSAQLGRNVSVICYSTLKKERWLQPKAASFSGEYMDVEPVFHPDGRLFFSSNRPREKGGAPGDYDIWYVEKTTDGWSEPINPGAPLNSNGNEFYPSFTAKGDCYFTAELPGGVGNEDIWVSRIVNGNFAKPENLGDSVNTPSFEYNAFVAPDESYLLYTTHGQGEGFGSADIYISTKTDEGWTKAQNMGNKVNSDGMDFCPYVSADGKTLYFSRKEIPLPTEEKWTFVDMITRAQSFKNGNGNIYFIGLDQIEMLNE